MPKHRKKQEPELSPWRRLSADVSADVADAVSGLLLDEGALGLETEDDETRAVPGRAQAPTGRAVVTATFSRVPGLEARVVARIVSLADHLPEAKDADLTWTDLFPEDWNAIFRAQWKPFRCGSRVWVCPSWERETFHAERVGEGPAPIVLYLDAGMAFGTGTHETTQLCIEAIEARCQNGKAPKAILDVGTGTGILSIAALKLGVANAKGTDIDPVAVKVSLENAANNGVKNDFIANQDMPHKDGPVWDAVVANILAGTLIDLVDVIIGSVAPGGALWLSGILEDQERAVKNTYVAKGLKHEGTSAKNGWVRIDLRRA